MGAIWKVDANKESDHSLIFLLGHCDDNDDGDDDNGDQGGRNSRQNSACSGLKFRPSPNFSAGATRAPMQLLPPCWTIQGNIFTLPQFLTKYDSTELQELPRSYNA